MKFPTILSSILLISSIQQFALVKSEIGQTQASPPSTALQIPECNKRLTKNKATRLFGNKIKRCYTHTKRKKFITCIERVSNKISPITAQTKAEAIVCFDRTQISIISASKSEVEINALPPGVIVSGYDYETEICDLNRVKPKWVRACLDIESVQDEAAFESCISGVTGQKLIDLLFCRDSIVEAKESGDLEVFLNNNSDETLLEDGGKGPILFETESSQCISELKPKNLKKCFKNRLYRDETSEGDFHKCLNKYGISQKKLSSALECQQIRLQEEFQALATACDLKTGPGVGNSNWGPTTSSKEKIETNLNFTITLLNNKIKTMADVDTQNKFRVVSYRFQELRGSQYLAKLEAQDLDEYVHVLVFMPFPGAYFLNNAKAGFDSEDCLAEDNF